MKQIWRVTMQGEPTTTMLVTTEEIKSVLQRNIFQGIKAKVRALGYDPRLIVDWEMELNLDAKVFAYWCPGGRTGEVIAETVAEAAQVVLKTNEVLCCAGETLSQPWIYVGHQSECKLWLRKDSSELGL